MLPDWPRAHGGVLEQARFKTTPADFVVDEVLGFAPDDDGEHDLLFIEKTDMNTHWLARKLAAHADIPVRDVGYCGLKDRRSVSRQWFSVRRPSARGTDWAAFEFDGVRLLRQHRHGRKLRPGSHRANRFRIELHPEVPVSVASVQARVRAIAQDGVPNYFGPQRFGIDAGNLELARSVFAGRRVRREQRSLAISAARSFLFNEVLARRVVDGSWARFVAGDLANLDGSASVFAVEAIDDVLNERLLKRDIHPAISLWGDDAPRTSGDSAALERTVLAAHDVLAAGLGKLRVSAGSRATRLLPQELDAEVAENQVVLEFELGQGQFATSVLRELFALHTPA